MKKLIFFFALLGCSTINASALNALLADSPPNIIVLDVINCTASHHMDALSVEVRVLDENGNTLGVAQTYPGQTVSFSYTGRERSIVYTYQMAGYIIMDMETP